MCCRTGACCFITNLRVATIIITILSLMGNVVVVVLTSWIFTETKLALPEVRKYDLPGFILANGLRVLLATLAVVLTLSFLAAILDLVLFVGAITRRRDMVQSWSYGHAVVYGVYLLYFWMLLVGNFAYSNSLIGFIFLIAYLIATVVSVYFWVVVHSFGVELRQMQLPTVFETSNSDKPPPYAIHL